MLKLNHNILYSRHGQLLRLLFKLLSMIMMYKLLVICSRTSYNNISKALLVIINTFCINYTAMDRKKHHPGVSDIF